MVRSSMVMVIQDPRPTCGQTRLKTSPSPLHFFALLRVSLCLQGYVHLFNIMTLFVAHFEHVPYDSSTKRSVYHLRSIDILKLSLVSIFFQYI